VSVFIRLGNESGFFVDPETGFSLRFKQEKPLPDNLGKRTRDWLGGGGLVRFNREKTVARFLIEEPEGGEVQTQATEELQETDNNSERQFDGLSVSDLRKLCRDVGLNYSRKQDRAELINLLTEFDAKAAQ
jgi:hypothetical protein